MKKIVALLMIIFMVALFTACGSASDTQGSEEQAEQTEQETTMETKKAKLLYMGHASVRITTPEDKVIYIDPFVGDGYGPAADLILSTHGHYDHTAFEKIENRNEDCQTITWKEALEGGQHQSFDLGYVQVDAVEAGYNKNHDASECVGYIITLSDGVQIYLSGDTSKTEQMASLAERNIDYAFYCCDGYYNMGREEATECANLVGAKHNIPYHVIRADSGSYFDREAAEEFKPDNRLIIEEGEEIELEK